jgi:uncharacterized phage protein (TIGR01671 family)
MNHPIRYRAWADDKMREVRAISFTETGEVHRIMDAEGVQRWPTALLRFTGLKDKNSKEIFEGDVIRLSNGILHVVQLREYTIYGHDEILGYWKDEDSEVLGNNYENPELIAKK